MLVVVLWRHNWVCKCETSSVHDIWLPVVVPWFNVENTSVCIYQHHNNHLAEFLRIGVLCMQSNNLPNLKGCKGVTLLKTLAYLQKWPYFCNCSMGCTVWNQRSSTWLIAPCLIKIEVQIICTGISNIKTLSVSRTEFEVYWTEWSDFS